MFVFELTKQGIDVLDSGLTPNDFIFSSRFNTFKILAEGELFSQNVSGDTEFNIAHGQAHVPAFYGFAQFPDGMVALPDCNDYSFQAELNAGYGRFSLEADSVNLTFKFSEFLGSYDVDIKWYIFESPL